MNTMNPFAPSIVAKRLSLFATVVGVAMAGPVKAIAQTAELPTGFAEISVAAGTGTAKRSTFISIPLLEEVAITGKSTGRITGVAGNTITSSGAGWTAGQLSIPSAPHLIEITSGAAQGQIMLISTATANTTDTVTIDSGELTRLGNLQNLGIATGADTGDTYRIWSADTLSSFFGTPETTSIQGGTSQANADTVVIVANGSSTTYFYNTAVNPPRWSRVGLGSPDASNLAIPPYAGVQYSRLPATPLDFRVLGRMPAGVRKVAVKNSGSTLLSSFWPVRQTLAGMALQNLPNWLSGPSANVADTVVLTSGGSATTYFHDGTNWRRVGLGSGDANATVVSVGASILINKKGNAAGYATYEHAAPYSFQ
jgi:hypothetical protein